MAVYGPFVTSTSSSFHNYYQQKWKSSERSVPLPYRVGANYSVGYWNVLITEGATSLALTEAGKLYTRTHDRFWSKMYAKAELAISLLEGKQSLTMITRRFAQIASAARNLRRFRFRAFLKDLGITNHPKTAAAMAKVKRNARSGANNWLEFTFGWVPLIEDIGNAVEVLQQDFNFFRHKTTVRSFYQVSQPWDGGSAYSLAGSITYVIGADVKVNNPNVFLANQLGFTNPARVLWDLVPFSFVFDWILPVGKFLGSLTASVGITLKNLFRGPGCRINGVSRHAAHSGGDPFPSNGFGGERVVGNLPLPGFFDRLRVPNLDPWLAITSLSLAVQQLSRLGAR